MNLTKRKTSSAAAEQSSEESFDSSSEKTFCTTQSDTTGAGGLQRPNSRQVDVDESEETEGTLASTSLEYEISYPIRGTAVIIDENKFLDHRLLCRHGSAKDADRLHRVFKKLGFDTILSLTNVTRAELMKKLEPVTKQQDSDIFVCVIMTHGEEGIIHTVDRPIQVDELLDLFDEEICPALAKKPKIFFIQSCRGSRTDGGIAVTDPPSTVECPHSETAAASCQEEIDAYPISSHNFLGRLSHSRPDMLIARSTLYGHYSFRNIRNGSWFIQELCEKLENLQDDEDLLSILTRVNRSVAMEYESCHINLDFHHKKQMPTIYSTLTKLLHFKHKSD